MLPNIFAALTNKIAYRAKSASNNGSFGVAAALLDQHGRVLTFTENRVVNGNYIDTTMHAEVQLVDWFIAHRSSIKKSVHNYTILTSVEPCLMCAGIILRENINCIALTTDQEAGVGIRKGFLSLPSRIRVRAKASLFLVNFPPSGNLLQSSNVRVLECTIRLAEKAFHLNLDKIRNNVHSTNSFNYCNQSILSNIDNLNAFDFCIIDQSGTVILRRKSHKLDDYVHYMLMESIKSLNKFIISQGISRAGVRFVFTKQFKDEIDYIICIGAIGSFYEGKAPKNAIIFINSRKKVILYSHWLKSLPHFYTDIAALNFVNIDTLI